MTPADPRDGLPKVQATAPERIWLAVSDEPSDRDEPFPPPHEDLCWSSDEPLATCVPYVRADLAHARPEAVDEAMVERACIAYYEQPAWAFMSHKAACKDRMRAALLTALTPERAP